MTQEESNKKLFQAVLSGKVDTVREVLSYGFSNINATLSGQDKTPLMLAARAGHTEMVYFLLSQGANAELETKRGETASSMALHWGHTEVVQALDNWIRQQKRDREALSSSSSLSSSFLANLWKPIRKGSADTTPPKGSSKEAAASTIVRSSTSPPLLTGSSSLIPTSSTPASSSLPSTPQGARTPTSPPISILSSFSPSTSTSTSSLSSTSSPRSTPESSLVREEDDDEQHFSGLPPAEGSVIDGNRISMTHEEFSAILAKEEQRYRDKERELRARLQRDQENNLNRWLTYLAKKKRKKKDRVDTIQMLRQQNATLQQRNNELRDRVLQLEKERKAWVTYGHGLFCPTPASQGVEGGEAPLEWLPINANLDYFRSVEPYRRGRWEDPLQGICLLKGRGPNATTYTIKTALLASRQGEEAALALENEVDSTLFHLPPHPNALNAVLAFTDSLPAAVAAEDWPSLPKSKKEVSRSAKFFVFEDLENYTTLQRVIRQRKRKTGSRLNNNQQREGEETTSATSSSSSSSSPRRHLLQQPVYLLPPKHIAFLVLQLLEMANHLYSHGIVHRNLSPANIFVRSTAAAAANNANRRDDTDRNSTNAKKKKKTKKKEQGDGDHIATRAHRRSREADASPGDPAGEGVLDIVPVDGVEPVEEGDDASSTRATSANVASRDSEDESEDEDGDVELIDVSANETGDSSGQDIYRLRVGNFSESIQVMKLPYSSRLISLGSSPSSIYLAPEVSSARPGRGVMVDYRKQDVWSIGVILHQLIYGRKPTAESIDALLDHHHHLDEGQAAAQTSRHTLRHPLKQPRHHQQHQQPRHSRDSDDDDNGWTTTALDVLLRRLLEPRASERFSASFALLFLRFALFGPKQRPMWRTHEQWVAWLRERRRLRPHPFYGECMARGGTRLLKKTTTSAAAALDEAGNVVDTAGQGVVEGGDVDGGNDDYVPRYLEWQHTQFVWSATPADLLDVVSCFESSA